jgi:hypothetical protein
VLGLDDTVAERLITRSVDDDFIRVYGRGFVLAPPIDVWTAAQDPQVMIAKCATTTQTVRPGAEAFTLSFVVHYFVDDVLDVEWDDQWRGDVVFGTPDAPKHVLVKHQKIMGSDFIDRSEGTIQIVDTDDPAISELRFVEHLDALTASQEDVIEGMQHTYDRLVSVAHGGPISPCP